MWRKTTYYRLASVAALIVTSSTAPLTRAQAANITYGIDLPVGAGSLTGTITTDGLPGLLFNPPPPNTVVSWDLNLTDSTGATATLTPANTSIFISPGSFTATATNLFFNFNGSGSFFNISGTPCFPQVSFRAGSGGTACSGASGPGIGVAAAAGGLAFATESGNLLIGTEIPLPPALYLFGSVLGGAFWLGRRKRSAAANLRSA